MKQPVIARLRRAGPVLICRKCLMRVPAGDRVRARLKRELKRRNAGRKAPRLVSVNCFGICPKGAIVLTSGRGLQDNEYMLVSRPRQIEAALERLLPPAPETEPPET